MKPLYQFLEWGSIILGRVKKQKNSTASSMKFWRWCWFLNQKKIFSSIHVNKKLVLQFSRSFLTATRKMFGLKQILYWYFQDLRIHLYFFFFCPARDVKSYICKCGIYPIWIYAIWRWRLGCAKYLFSLSRDQENLEFEMVLIKSYCQSALQKW